MSEYERLLREFIAALEALHDINRFGDIETVKDLANECDYINGAFIPGYKVVSKLSEMKTKLLSLPL